MSNEKPYDWEVIKTRIDALIEAMHRHGQIRFQEIRTELEELLGEDPWLGSTLGGTHHIRAALLDPRLLQLFEIEGVSPSDDPNNHAVRVAVRGYPSVTREHEDNSEAFCLAIRDSVRVANEERRKSREAEPPPF
jgi:hypothetical protein